MASKKGRIRTFINGIKTYVSISGEGSGGQFYTDSEGDKHIVLEYHDDWHSFVGVFLHEVCEMTMAYLGFRYNPDRLHKGTDGVCFFLDHNQFSEVMAIAGGVVADVLPSLADLYGKEAEKLKGES